MRRTPKQTSASQTRHLPQPFQAARGPREASVPPARPRRLCCFMRRSLSSHGPSILVELMRLRIKTFKHPANLAAAASSSQHFVGCQAVRAEVLAGSAGPASMHERPAVAHSQAARQSEPSGRYLSFLTFITTSSGLPSCPLPVSGPVHVLCLFSTRLDRNEHEQAIEGGSPGQSVST